MEFSLILAAELVCDAELIKCIPLKILTCMNWEERRRHQRDSMIQRDYRSLCQVNVLNDVDNVDITFLTFHFLNGAAVDVGKTGCLLSTGLTQEDEN